jgi:hypothetical protein
MHASWSFQHGAVAGYREGVVRITRRACVFDNRLLMGYTVGCVRRGGL